MGIVVLNKEGKIQRVNDGFEKIFQYSSKEVLGKNIEELANQKKIKAVGEIGLDFYYNHSPRNEQEEALRHQLHIAQKHSFPVVMHIRNSADEVVKAVEQENFTQGGVLHCFSESWGLAKKMMNHNFYISFSGIVTYPKAHSLREVARKIPLTKLLVETDSPFLVPVPYRGRTKRNEPAFVKEVAKVLAEIKGISLEAFAEATTRNFQSLFMIEIKKTRC